MKALLVFAQLVLFPIIITVVIPGIIVLGLIYCFEHSII